MRVLHEHAALHRACVQSDDYDEEGGRDEFTLITTNYVWANGYEVVRCENGHKLRAALLHPTANNTWYCDGCEEPLMPNCAPGDKHFGSCRECGYDLCPECLRQNVSNGRWTKPR